MLIGEVSILAAGICFASVVVVYCVITVAHERKDFRDIRSKGRGE